jgi:P-type Cu+ transporter
MADNTVSLPLTGMTCTNCAANIERGLSRLEGVRQVNVNFASERAEVTFDPARLTVQDVIERVRKSGYEVPLGRVEMPITGMTCANCVANVERALKKKVDGVVDASVNFGSERASVTYLPDRVTIEQIVAAIEKAGYGAVLPEEGEAGQDAELAARQAEVRDQTRKFIVGVIFTTPLFIISMLRDFHILGPWSHAMWVNWLLWALATPVQFYTGWDYYVGGYKSLRNRGANMDVLVALGSSVAYFYSLALLDGAAHRRPRLF